MIEDIETIFRVVASKFNLPDVFLKHTGFYKIKDAEIEYTSGLQNDILEDIARQETSRGGAYGFYLDTKYLEVEELIAALGLQRNLIPYDETSPNELAEMIVLHEITHLIDMQDLKNNVGIELTECDIAIGEKIEKHLNKYDTDIVHTKEFVGILNNLIKRVYPDEYVHKLRVAMSKTVIDIESDIQEGADEDFYDCENELNKNN